MFMRVSNRIRIKVSKTFETFGENIHYIGVPKDFIYFFLGGDKDTLYLRNGKIRNTSCSVRQILEFSKLNYPNHPVNRF